MNLQFSYDEEEGDLTLEILDHELSTLETVGILELLKNYLNSTNIIDLI